MMEKKELDYIGFKDFFISFMPKKISALLLSSFSLELLYSSLSLVNIYSNIFKCKNKYFKNFKCKNKI